MHEYAAAQNDGRKIPRIGHNFRRRSQQDQQGVQKRQRNGGRKQDQHNHQHDGIAQNQLGAVLVFLAQPNGNHGGRAQSDKHADRHQNDHQGKRQRHRYQSDFADALSYENAIHYII